MPPFLSFFFFNDTATTEIYTLSLPTLFRSHAERRRADAPDLVLDRARPPRANLDVSRHRVQALTDALGRLRLPPDRKSTRLNSSHSQISYAVFCLKKKKRHTHVLTT